MNKYNLKTFIAFTLAEVLITLGIIGVVCAMTIPTLMRDSRNKELESKFTKAYSIMSQAVMNMKNEEGQIWAAYNYRDNFGRTGYDPYKSFQTAIEKYFKKAQDCGANSCVPNATYYQNYSNTSSFCDSTNLSQKQFYLPDGTLIFPMIYGSPNTVVGLWADINGYQKKPNRAGYDLFFFEITPNDTLVPAGGPNAHWANSCSSSATDAWNGLGCSIKVFTDVNYFKNLP